MNFRSRQVDFTQAFPQAPLDDDVFLKVPQGWYYDPKEQKLQQSTDPQSFDSQHCIKLKKNLYGVKQAAFNWFQHCRQGFIDKGFKPSNVDPCLFLRDDCIIVVYTDDCSFFAHNDSTINDVISSLKKNYQLKDEGEVKDFLGIRIQKEDDPKTVKFVKINMTQTGLIDQILKDVNLLHGPNSKQSSDASPA